MVNVYKDDVLANLVAPLLPLDADNALVEVTQLLEDGWGHVEITIFAFGARIGDGSNNRLVTRENANLLEAPAADTRQLTILLRILGDTRIMSDAVPRRDRWLACLP